MTQINSDYLIRRAKFGDGKGFVEYWNEGIKRKFFIYTGKNSLRTKKDIINANKRYKKISKDNFVFVAIDKTTGKIVGTSSVSAGVGRNRHRAELGWFVHPDYTRKGIATQLVKSVIEESKKNGIKRIEAEIVVKNIPSIKVAKKFGFILEGKRKSGLLLDNGKYVDTYLFGKILR